MRDMHKWKDKTEFSLDNRQIFFLFFGLSVVGCFVFALGVMVGRRVAWEPQGEVAALGGSLAMLEDEVADVGLPEEHLTFKDGLAEPATGALPETRDPAEATAAKPQEDDSTTDAKADAAPASTAKAEVPAPGAGGTSQAQPKSKPSAVPSSKKDGGDDAVMAAVDRSPKPGVDGDHRRFTLQMKAFARSEEAEAFADKLRRNGHDIRVEQHEVRGRVWHRVRMGTFNSWEAALKAKSDFEKAEHVIAYVVRHE